MKKELGETFHKKIITITITIITNTSQILIITIATTVIIFVVKGRRTVSVHVYEATVTVQSPPALCLFASLNFLLLCIGIVISNLGNPVS